MDIAIPYSNAIKLEGFPEDLFQKNWFGNLEGSLIVNKQANNNKSKNNGVYNDFDGIAELLKQFNYLGFVLANNHIFDKSSYLETIENLERLNMKFCGIGSNLLQACQPLILKENNSEFIIINLGWKVIQCNIAKKK